MVTTHSRGGCAGEQAPPCLNTRDGDPRALYTPLARQRLYSDGALEPRYRQAAPAILWVMSQRRYPWNGSGSTLITRNNGAMLVSIKSKVGCEFM